MLLLTLQHVSRFILNYLMLNVFLIVLQTDSNNIFTLMLQSSTVTTHRLQEKKRKYTCLA